MPEQPTRSTLDELRASVEHPVAWKPQPGETLAGEAVRWEAVTIERQGEEPKPCSVLVIRDGSGVEHGIWTWHTVLRNELVGKVSPGDFVAVHYLGMRTKQSGDGTYAGYRVAVRKAERDDATEKAEGSQGDDIPF
jgi:hypothetical protein